MSDNLPQAPPSETDERFPSGPWRGYFIQWSSRSRTELDLRFSNGLISGHGADWVGEFTIKGRYQTDDGKCWWTKRYVRGHDVAYQGYNEGRGIWGVWEINSVQWRGGFHIWPKGQEEGEHLDEAVERSEETVVFETAPAGAD